MIRQSMFLSFVLVGQKTSFPTFLGVFDFLLSLYYVLKHYSIKNFKAD